MLRAVLFDWGDTLMEWAWDPARLVEGHEAGLRAIGREGPAITDRFTEAYLPLIFRPGVVEEVERLPRLEEGAVPHPQLEQRGRV